MTFDQNTFLSSILIGGFPYDQCVGDTVEVLAQRAEDWGFLEFGVILGVCWNP